MQQETQSLQVSPGEDPEYGYIITTLYELIRAIDEELQPGEEELVGSVVSDLAKRGKITFAGKHHEMRFMGERKVFCTNNYSNI